MRSISILASMAALLQAVTAADDPFTYDRNHFYLNGEIYQMRGGEMDPQRTPRVYWKDRLAMARAMGLNTIFSYVYWNNLEPTEGAWEYSGDNNITSFFEVAQEEGLNVILRPGPYICGEHEWGGFPAWLSEVPDMEVRTNNKPFLDASKSYLDRLAAELAPLSVTKGGPILMVQIENEYGSFGKDYDYKIALREMFKEAFDVPFYTNDGGGKDYLIGGQIPGVLAETDGDPKEGFAARDKYVTDPSSLGPQIDGEYYTTWIDTWGPNNEHQTKEGNPEAIKKVQEDIDWILSNNHSFSLFMFHGGSNWGFQNGALFLEQYAPVTSSYDYGAPLDESGRPTELFHALKKTISAYIPDGETVPDIPEMDNLIEIPEFELKPSVAMFDSLPEAISQKTPTHMEAIGQSVGFILYRHKATADIKGALKAGDGPRDRVLVYVNDKRVGVIDATHETPNTVNLDIKSGDVLDLLVENMGRVDYGPKLSEQRKGIVGKVSIGESELQDWQTYPMSLDQPPKEGKGNSGAPDAPTGKDSAPIFYTGTFKLDKLGDSYLELPGWTKGVVWVNGVNLGRYWIVGPQQSLYVPGCYLHDDKDNEVTVLALEPLPDANTAVGISTRKWGNNPDPDAA